MYVVLASSSQPLEEKGGRAWRSVDGDPAYCSVSYHDGAELPVIGSHLEEADIWVGRLQWPSPDEAMVEPATDPGGLLVFAQEPRPGDEDEFDAWMGTEHLPRLAGVPGVLLARQFVAARGKPRFAALYHLLRPEVCSSDEWRAASRTPWRARMSQRNVGRRRGLYEPMDGGE